MSGRSKPLLVIETSESFFVLPLETRNHNQPLVLLSHLKIGDTFSVNEKKEKQKKITKIIMKTKVLYRGYSI